MAWFRKILNALFGSPANFDDILAKPDRYLTEAEIVDDILWNADDAAIRSWLAIPKDDVIMGHHSTGQNIRNHYRLWEPENPYTDGMDSFGPRHPDQTSIRIMESVWERARQVAIKRGIPVPPPDPEADARIAKRRARIAQMKVIEFEPVPLSSGTGTPPG